MSRKVRKNLILWLSVLSSITIYILSNEDATGIHIICMGIVTIASCWFVDFNVYHSMCWFPPFFFLYTCGYSILYLIGANTKYGYTKEPIFLCLLSLICVIIAFPNEVKKVRRKENINSKDRNNLRKLDTLEVLISIAIIVSIVYIIRSGFSGKREIYSRGGIIINLVFRLVYFEIILFTYSLYMKLMGRESVQKSWIIAIETSVIMFSAVTGERNYMFQIALITLICFSLAGKIKWYHLVGTLIGMVVLIPLSRSFKYYILTRSISAAFSWNNLLVEFLDGEFISAGRNLQLLSANGYINYFHGESLINDIVRLFYDTGYSNQTWFHDVFFTNSSTGYGFTIVGEGYVNGGYFGVIFLMTMMGLLIRMLYSNAKKSRYYMVIYIYMIPFFIYSIRADFANILSALLKYSFVGIILIKIIEKVQLPSVKKTLAKKI